MPVFSSYSTKVARFAGALYNIALDNATGSQVLESVNAVGFSNLVNEVYASDFGSTSNETVAATVAANLGLTGTALTNGTSYILGQLNAAAANAKGSTIATILDAFAGATSDATYGSFASAWNARVENAVAYSNTASNTYIATFTDLSNAASGKTYTLATIRDSIVGTSGNDTFNAYIINASNTLQSGDMLTGGSGTDTLNADIGNSQGFAITPHTSGIESVAIRAEATPVDSHNGNNMGTNTVTIDAQRMVDVTTWTSSNSRADVIIEDVRIGASQITKDITIEMVETDPGNVDYGVYFDHLSLRNTSASTSVLNIKIMDTGAAAASATSSTPLLNQPYDTFKFLANGTLVSLQLPNAGAADTYAQLLTAFQTALTNAGLTTVTASLGSNFSVIDPISGSTVTGQTILLTASSSVAITTDTTSGWFNTTGASVPPTSNIYTTYDTSSSSSSALVTSTVVLDDVGRGSTGGDLVIGSLSVSETSTSRGVERFEITVKDNSKLQTINSTNNALREVTIVNGTTSSAPAASTSTAYVPYATNAGNLTVNGNAGNTSGDTILKGVNSGNSTLNTYAADHHGAYGFTDVRLIDASAMTGKLAFTAQITNDSIAKYITTVDTAASPTADVASNNTLNSMGANFVYTGGTNNDTLAVTIDPSVAASRSNNVSGRHDFTFSIDGGSGDDAITVNVAPSLSGNAQNWYNNQNLNDNISITGGAGADVIKTPGAGDTNIDAGAGNDVVYTDNTGAQTGLVTTGAVNTPTGKGVWVYNTIDQTTATAATTHDARNVNNLRSDVNTSYNLYKSTLYVTFLGIQSSTITIDGTGYKTTNLEFNQAIKNAINNDATLKNLLIARDGPANSLVVESLIDGVMTTADLTVTVNAPVTGKLSTTEVAAAASAYSMAVGSTEAQVLNTMATALTTLGTNNDYTTALGTDGVVLLTGADSTTTSDNFVTPGTGNDVIVLGTTEDATAAADFGLSSNEVVILQSGFGNDVIVNFDLTGPGIDHIDYSAFIGSTSPTVSAAIASTDGLVTIVPETTSNDSVSEITALYNALANTTSSKKQVYVAYSTVTAAYNDATNNVAKVYSVTDGTGASDVTVTLEGTIDLADSSWASFGVNNATVPSKTYAGIIGTSVPAAGGGGGGGGSTAVAVSAAGSSNASGADYTYTFSRAADYTYTISNFAAGDKIVGPTGGSAVSFGTSQSSFTDGTVTLVYALAGQTVNVTLTGLTAAQDGALMSPSDLNTVFGTGTLA